MFVRSRPNSPPRLDRFTILSSASYARASLAHAVDDLKPIEFFSLSPTIFYTFYFVRFPLLTILYNRRNFFIRSRFLTPTRPFIYQHPSTRFQKAQQTPHHWTRYSLERSPRNFTPRVTISRYVFAVQCAPRSAVRISSFLFHECTYARMFLHAAYRPSFLSHRAAFKKLHFIRASLLVIRSIMSSSFVSFFLVFFPFFSFSSYFLGPCARAHPARSISETWLKRMGWQRSNIPKLIDGIYNID